jgi:triacylglycerol lipase
MFAWIYASFVEIFALLGVVILRLLPVRNQPKNHGGRPILLIHGYVNHGSVWFFQKRNLEKLGFGPIYTINLGNPFHSIKRCAEKVRSKVEAIAHLTGRKDLILICHSRGGLVASWYATHYSNHVTDLITIATPLNGTYMAYLAPAKSAKEMRPNSTFLKELHAVLTRGVKFRMYHIGTCNDPLVVPKDSVFLEGNPRYLMSGIGHAALLYSRRVSDKIAEWLTESGQCRR